ncbi:MAG: hypothetical protein IJH34_04300, partial [Romboutsia sp.]|nr:hypothetical protein [Romboutsia sp.]
MKRCTRCINDKTVLNIKFDENGVCNFCNEYDKLQNHLNDIDLEKIWQGKISRIKGKYKYDAAVGLSGGKDSVYILYQLVKKYNLKVKTFTMDNGFLTDMAKERIDKIVKELGVEHEYITFEKEDLKKVYKLSMRKTFAPCSGCSYMGYTMMIEFAAKNEIPLVIHGRSKPQMFRALREKSNDPFMILLKEGLKPLDEQEDIEKTYDRVLLKCKDVLGEELSKYMENSLSLMKEKEIKCEFLSYFLYHDYDEEEVFKFLESNTSWKRPINTRSSHFDCGIHDATAYLYQQVELRPHILPELSVMIREGTISREEALEILNKKIIKNGTTTVYHYDNENQNDTIFEYKNKKLVRKIENKYLSDGKVSKT